MLFLTILLFAITGMGIILPSLIYRKVIISNAWTQTLALLALFSVATVVTLLCRVFGINTDPATIFVRVVLVDGVSLAFLNIAPTTKPKAPTDA